MTTTKKVLIGFAAVPVFAGILFLVGLLVQGLWNWLMPAVFGLGRITYLQAWGLLLLARILFGEGLRGHCGRRRDGGSFRDHVGERVRPAQTPDADAPEGTPSGA